MLEKLTQGAICAKEKASAGTESARDEAELARRLKEFPEFAWVGEDLGTVKEFTLKAAANLVRFFGDDPKAEQVVSTLGLSLQAAEERAELEELKRRVKRARGQAPA